MAAINNQRRRLKEAGVLQTAFVGRRHHPWTIRELRQLTRLTREHGFSAGFIAQLQLVAGRSQQAISKMMGRYGLGDPVVKERARQAQRLSKERRRELEHFLRQEGRYWPSAEVAPRWGLAEQTVTGYRRRLGVALSWPEARASQRFQEGQQRRGRAWSEQLRKLWEERRREREQRLRGLRSRLEEQAKGAPPRRRCAECAELWFATQDFFHVQKRERNMASISRTCRLCRAAQRRERTARRLQEPRMLAA
jgi:hypothetical protein